MRYTFALPSALAAICLLAITSTIEAHTWVEEVRLIASNGSYVGNTGYIRGFGPRLPNVDPDLPNVYLLPPNGRSTGNTILSTDLMCKSNQVDQVQTLGYPRLTAAPQDNIALRYEENGHVTLFINQKGKPLGRGTVFVYGTSQQSSSDTYLGIHRVWNEAGTGGDKRGKLLASRPFDDGRCFQQPGDDPPALEIARRAAINFPDNGGDVKCQAAVQIPADTPTNGTYTLYWVWEWPTLDTNGAIVTNESYTSCMDIDMISKPVPPAGKYAQKVLLGADANSVAIENQLETAFQVNPTAHPKIAPDNPGPAPAPTAPTKSSAPAATSSAPKSSANSAPAGFITVTVTTHEVSTAFVTITREGSTTSSIPTVSPSSPIAAPVPSTSTIQTTITSSITKTVAAPTPSSLSSSSTSLSSVVTVPLVLSQPPSVTGFLPASTGFANTTSRPVRLRARRVRL